jgi:hypothetical protein
MPVIIFWEWQNWAATFSNRVILRLTIKNNVILRLTINNNVIPGLTIKNNVIPGLTIKNNVIPGLRIAEPGISSRLSVKCTGWTNLNYDTPARSPLSRG